MRAFWGALVFLLSCGAGPVVEKPIPVGTPKPNTRDGATIVVIGNGAPELRSPSVHVAQQDAQNAAQGDVTGRMERFINAIQMPDGETIEAKSKRDANIKTKIDKLIQNHKTIDKRYFSDGSMDLIAEVSITALVSAATGAAEKKERSPDVELIIDARKAKTATLTLLPVFQNSKGETLFTELKTPQMSLATTIDAARSMAKKAPVVVVTETSPEGRLLVADANWDKITKINAPSIVVVFAPR
jgi:hypothetical protein